MQSFSKSLCTEVDHCVYEGINSSRAVLHCKICTSHCESNSKTNNFSTKNSIVPQNGEFPNRLFIDVKFSGEVSANQSKLEEEEEPADTREASDVARSEVFQDGTDDFVGKDSEVSEGFRPAIPQAFRLGFGIFHLPKLITRSEVFGG